MSLSKGTEWHFDKLSDITRHFDKRSCTNPRHFDKRSAQ
jgi:hypothetical protein